MLGEFYRGGARMGFTPQQIDRMGLWEYNQLVAGWQNYYHAEKSDEKKYVDKAELMDLFGANEVKANGPEKPKGERLSYKPKT